MQSHYVEANRKLWNSWTHLNAVSEMYDLEQFKVTRDSLQEIEKVELGDVRGKSLLHLMCHLGLDSLAWAGRGARVTGIDISDDSITFATELAQELAIEAEFLRSDVMELPTYLSGTFDIVYTSYGVLSWIPDLGKWAEIAAGYMRRDSVFYMAEHHPIRRVLFPRREDDAGHSLDVNYFGGQEPTKVEEWGSYANHDAVQHQTAYYWHHTLGDVVTALANAGMRVEYLHEFPAKKEQLFHGNPLGIDPATIPYFFSVRATLAA